METKNICGKIPVELHEKVREETGRNRNDNYLSFYKRLSKSIL